MLHVKFVLTILLLCFSTSLWADPTASNTQQDKPSEDILDEARELFTQRCVTCHGKRGDGKGSLSGNLNPRPTNLRSNVWFRGTNAKRIKRVILGGGGALGKSILMPANPDLRNKPKLVNALVYYIMHLVDRTPKK